MSKTRINRRDNEDGKRIKKVGKTVKSKLDKYPTRIYNYDSSSEEDDEFLDEMFDELYYEEHKYKN